MELDQFRDYFTRLYGHAPRIFSAPGRVNLIGDHTDYNDGFVLPMAANRRTYVAAALRDDGLFKVHSCNLADNAEFSLDTLPRTDTPGWLRYVEGITRVLAEKGFELKGADLAISSEVPIGAGLSSSAALEISVGFALVKLAGAEIEMQDLAVAAQIAEHRFVGTQSGLMDQLTAVFAVSGHAMLIDCRSHERTMISLNMPATAIVVCDTKVKHELATSGYNQRRRECEEAIKILRQANPSIQTLRDLTIANLESSAPRLSETLYHRCRHVVSENERTIAAAAALLNGDVLRLGELMNCSHESLQQDYQVSCRELDIMVDLGRKQAGVTGARMMGGGFGGSTVNLVVRRHVEQFRENVARDYEQATGLEPSIITIEADDGVTELD